MRHPAGFSLVELSIVLVILGLLTGGILAGQSLIHAAELRRVSSDVQRYITAVNSFQDKYFQIPGDSTNAFSFWSTNCAATAVECNGNGDGRFYSLGAAGYQESYRFWQHLALAGLIEGSYTGVYSAGTVIPGNNVPRTSINNASFWPYNWPLPSYYMDGCCGNFAGNDTRLLNFGGVNSATDWPSAPTMIPEDVWNIDKKMDDGKPGTGKVIGTPSTGATCMTSGNVADIATADYALSNTSKVCRVGFIF